MALELQQAMIKYRHGELDAEQLEQLFGKYERLFPDKVGAAGVVQAVIGGALRVGDQVYVPKWGKLGYGTVRKVSVMLFLYMTALLTSVVSRCRSCTRLHRKPPL